MPRKAAALALCLVLAGCGGRADVYEVPPDAPSGATRALELPDPIPAVPVLRVDARGGNRLAADLSQLPGVAVVAPAAVDRLRVSGPAGTSTVRVAAADPLVFRPVAPSSTREADFVWTSLLGGAAVLTRDAAEALGLTEGGELAVAGRQIRVGAFADNGVPNLADVMVSDQLGRALGLRAPSVFVIGARSGASIDRLQREARRAVGARGRVRRLLPSQPAPVTPPAAPEPVGPSGGVIPPMTFEILRTGFIRPDPAWVAGNIVSADVPILGRVTCHRLMIPQLHAALAEIEREGLAGLIRPGDYGGCFVPRFIDRDPSKPLSMHAFGLAVDLNVSTNPLGERGDMDPRLIEIFGRWGFAWGGYWDRPDPMHFELVRLL